MVLVTGASGRIGRRTAQLLFEQGQPIRLMSRTPDAAPRLAGVDVVYGDFEKPETLPPALNGISSVFVISGTALPGKRAHTHKNFFQAAARAGVGHVVYLSLKGAATDSKYPYCRDHAESERLLAESGVPWTSLRGAFYIDMFLEKFDRQGVIHGPAGDGRGAFISRENTARAAAAAISAPPWGILDVTGPELLSVAEIADRLASLIGCPLRYEQESAQQTRNRVSGTNLPEWRQELEPRWFEAIEAGEQQPVTGIYHLLTGEEPMTLEEYFTMFPSLQDGLRRGRK